MVQRDTRPVTTQARGLLLVGTVYGSAMLVAERAETRREAFVRQGGGSWPR